MTATNLEEQVLSQPSSATVLPASRARPAPRPRSADWPATQARRDTTWARLTRPPFAPGPSSRHRPGAHHRGLGQLLDWLEDQPGQTWQDRWLATGVDTAGKSWREIPRSWLREHGVAADWHHEAFFRALWLTIAADVIRPAVSMLVVADIRRGALTTVMTRYRDTDGLTRLRTLCSADPGLAPAKATRISYRAAQILAAKGGVLADITPGDVLELLDAEADAHGTGIGATHTFYRMLHTLDVFSDQAPATLRELRNTGQRSPEELIDRYGLVCRPIRDLLVNYLRERQPALDYSSLATLANILGNLFWADLERHHPGIDSLHLPAEIADAWKQRLRTVTRTRRTREGGTAETTVTTTVARVNYRECLTPVRAFYLDLAHWAVEDPARWGPWVAPCPVGREEVNRTKDKRHRKSRMDARTRARLPVLPILVRTVNQWRHDAAALLEEARRTPPGHTFTAAGHTLVRVAPPRSAATKIWAEDPATGQRRDLGREEDYAFWAFATVEVLRATGVRVEELTELSHHSLVQYRLPTTGELVPLLQIAPSKTDTERLLVVSPELADVLSAVIQRVRGTAGAIPLLAGYDVRECVWLSPMPLLFQRRIGSEDRAITPAVIREILDAALARTGLTDPATGEPLRFTPHDFRRVFITDAVLNGLPPHIAQVVAGHRDINVTMGYKAVYPDEAIQAHLAFLARRRSLRPSEEYRVPTEEEWAEFLGHFEKRKVSIGTCGRAFSTPCIHEHACVRCSMLWPDPVQRDRLVEIRDNLVARIIEAKREGWLGEVEGLQISLAGANDKLAQINKSANPGRVVNLGIPTFIPDGTETGDLS
ncbi:site-specific integrase [Kutzneria buriramensis]|uniref:Phage integrase family protein n=1 Tax=Kutzneria buriramensis TaxID=1045776 RepID=A0A3E0I905_9PSEU|nr:site-specific integrase [Kutzneria buriramensis]REH55202.1 phage integrase family protein [Kutzneria buriramensis]